MMANYLGIAGTMSPCFSTETLNNPDRQELLASINHRAHHPPAEIHTDGKHQPDHNGPQTFQDYSWFLTNDYSDHE